MADQKVETCGRCGSTFTGHLNRRLDGAAVCSLCWRDGSKLCSQCEEKRHDPKFKTCYSCREAATILCGECGEKRHDPKFKRCFGCNKASRANWITCKKCGKKEHDPRFDACYECNRGGSAGPASEGYHYDSPPIDAYEGDIPF